MKSNGNASKILTIIFSIFILFPVNVNAKASNDQAQIILLNDSASALEDTNLDLSKRLTQLADEKEKQWEYLNENKAIVVSDNTPKDKAKLQDQLNLLNDSAKAVEGTYPLLAKALIKMAQDTRKDLKSEK